MIKVLKVTAALMGLGLAGTSAAYVDANVKVQKAEKEERVRDIGRLLNEFAQSCGIKGSVTEDYIRTFSGNGDKKDIRIFSLQKEIERLKK